MSLSSSERTDEERKRGYYSGNAPDTCRAPFNFLGFSAATELMALLATRSTRAVAISSYAAPERPRGRARPRAPGRVRRTPPDENCSADERSQQVAQLGRRSPQRHQGTGMP